MPEQPARFWDTIPGLVEAMVTSVRGLGPQVRAPVIAYLRDLERVARQEQTRRQAVQVIASGRRLLGDRTEIGTGLGRSFRTSLLGDP